jgi:hypothetical protein
VATSADNDVLMRSDNRSSRFLFSAAATGYVNWALLLVWLFMLSFTGE